MTGMSRLLGSGEHDPSELNVDRLSTLPWDVLNNIFGKLTILDAVKTSSLAKDWRYKWLAHSGFSFDSDVIARRRNQEVLSWDVVASAVNKFLRHHTSSISSFSLRTYCSEHYPDMYQWIQYLSGQDVEVLSIQELCNSYFKMPSYLFSFEKLKSFSLTTCAIRIPSTFVRFNWLAELILRDVSVCDADLARLIFSCPLLDNLVLWNIYRLKNLMIHAPKLTRLTVDTEFEAIFIEAAPGLFTASITPTFREAEDRAIFYWHTVIRCLSDLVSLQHLTLSGDLIKFLAADYGLENFPLRNNAVEYLKLNDIKFESVEVLRVCLSLLSSCHNIRSFHFSIESAKSAKLLAKFIRENWGRFCFPKLQRITVICPGDVSMGSAENFIDYVISQSPNLRYLTIQKGGGIVQNAGRLTNLLQRFRSSCPHALVSCEQGGAPLPL